MLDSHARRLPLLELVDERGVRGRRGAVVQRDVSAGERAGFDQRADRRDAAAGGEEESVWELIRRGFVHVEAGSHGRGHLDRVAAGHVADLARGALLALDEELERRRVGVGR